MCGAGSSGVTLAIDLLKDLIYGTFLRGGRSFDGAHCCTSRTPIHHGHLADNAARRNGFVNIVAVENLQIARLHHVHEASMCGAGSSGVTLAIDLLKDLIYGTFLRAGDPPYARLACGKSGLLCCGPP